MKKLILILSSVFLSINVYSQTFRENLDRTTNYIDSMCDYSRSLYYNNSGRTSIFLENKKIDAILKNATYGDGSICENCNKNSLIQFCKLCSDTNFFKSIG